jgi:SAM-dependent methyltransferase
MSTHARNANPQWSPPPPSSSAGQSRRREGQGLLQHQSSLSQSSHNHHQQQQQAVLPSSQKRTQPLPIDTRITPHSPTQILTWALDWDASQENSESLLQVPLESARRGDLQLFHQAMLVLDYNYSHIPNLPFWKRGWVQMTWRDSQERQIAEAKKKARSSTWWNRIIGIKSTENDADKDQVNEVTDLSRSALASLSATKPSVSTNTDLPIADYSTPPILPLTDCKPAALTPIILSGLLTALSESASPTTSTTTTPAIFSSYFDNKSPQKDKLSKYSSSEWVQQCHMWRQAALRRVIRQRKRQQANLRFTCLFTAAAVLAGLVYWTVYWHGQILEAGRLLLESTDNTIQAEAPFAKSPSKIKNHESNPSIKLGEYNHVCPTITTATATRTDDPLYSHCPNNYIAYKHRRPTTWPTIGRYHDDRYNPIVIYNEETHDTRLMRMAEAALWNRIQYWQRAPCPVCQLPVNYTLREIEKGHLDALSSFGNYTDFNPRRYMSASLWPLAFVKCLERQTITWDDFVRYARGTNPAKRQPTIIHRLLSTYDTVSPSFLAKYNVDPPRPFYHSLRTEQVPDHVYFSQGWEHIHPITSMNYRMALNAMFNYPTRISNYTVLDVGCGVGGMFYSLRPLRYMHPVRYHGISISPAEVDWARRWYSYWLAEYEHDKIEIIENGVYNTPKASWIPPGMKIDANNATFAVGSFDDPLPPESYHAILAFDVLSQSRNLTETVTNLYQALIPGGVLAIRDFISMDDTHGAVQEKIFGPDYSHYYDPNHSRYLYARRKVTHPAIYPNVYWQELLESLGCDFIKQQDLTLEYEVFDPSRSGQTQLGVLLNLWIPSSVRWFFWTRWRWLCLRLWRFNDPVAYRGMQAFSDWVEWAQIQERIDDALKNGELGYIYISCYK